MSEDIEPQCPICVENWNRSTRLPIPCPACPFIACRSCYQTFLLQQPEPKCMSCPRVITRREMVEQLTQKFVNQDLKLHREQLLLEKERSMLPATQAIVEELNQQEDVRRKIIRLRNEIQMRYHEIRRLNDYLNRSDDSTLSKERKVFIRKCPNTECRGFLSTQWKCTLCNKRTCKDCNECILEDEHKCHPDHVETAKLLAKDTKPCPNCGEMIFKIDGCDQIFCTVCHHAFSWRTGRAETGTIHNPHYFEWIRRNNRTVDQDMVVRCGREIDNYFLRELSRMTGSDYMLTLCRNLIHFRATVLPRYTVRPFEDNQGLRIAYLRQEIDEKAFKTTLQQREKARQKKEEYYRLFAMLIQCVTDIVYRFVDDVRRIEHADPTEAYNALSKNTSSYLRRVEAVNTEIARLHETCIPKEEFMARLNALRTKADMLRDHYEAAATELSEFNQTVDAIEKTYVDEIKQLVLYVNECLETCTKVYKARRYTFDHFLNFN